MSDLAVSTGLLDRALRRVTSLWRDMAGSASAGAEEDFAAQMRACLEARGGEVSARARAAGLAQAYLDADHAGRGDFLRALASFDSDPDAVRAAWEKVAAATGVAERAAAKARLRRALEPPRLRLLTQFTAIPDGVKFVVNLRADLIARMKGEPMLEALEGDFRTLLAAWFDVGFLELRAIDWSSPASLLEKLVGYEAVHRIRTWRDLKNRLDSDRRCYAFFHPRMPEEPLIFVEVALVKGLADNVQALLDEKAPLQDPRKADTAIFYSINNCQRGLDGISFGNFLIKRVVALLSAEFGNLKAFATLSPIPGFRRWLEERIAAADVALINEEEAAALRTALPPDLALPAPATDGAVVAPRPPAGETSVQALARVLSRRMAVREEAVAKALDPVLLRACARYLLAEGGRDPKRARDPVAHFHLSNGARVERLNPRGDVSEKGWRESAGMMVNYLYDPAKIEDYHEEYAGEGKRAASSAVRKLAKGFI
ncbi:malonyl-CoA decarboxylase [Roseomonas sp. AR75]|uniref:malonyl-CoA decarboxylase n=1 Tax=Roseomonas sp. AR75 TaxID=2562311 RepID=UPI0010C12277|nr:malonyl-CoA decarboxylase [Roseomonas sp. AR75]